MQLWASGYEMYDRISPSFREYLATLTATSKLPYFKQCADENGFEIKSPRGSPENSGDNFTTVHPVIRTNPVTGWRNVYASGLYFNKINDVTSYESQQIMDYLKYLITK
jgi:alpha-ketoglutarate-dependent taurine dioxygenase